MNMLIEEYLAHEKLAEARARAATHFLVHAADAEGPGLRVALGLALRHLANTGIVMEATAHPDDVDARQAAHRIACA